MKKIAVFTVLMMFGLFIRAQSESGKPTFSKEKDPKTTSRLNPVRMGFTGNFNLGWLSNDKTIGCNNPVKLGGSWGFVSNFRLKALADNYFLSTGFKINSLKASTAISSSKWLVNEGDSLKIAGTLSREISNKYLEIPLMMHLESNTKNPGLGIFGDIGVGVGILLRSNAFESFSPEKATYDSEFAEPQNISDNVSNFSFDLIVGGGVSLTLQSKSTILLGIKYHNGVTKVINDQEISESSKFPKSSFNYVSIELGFLF